MKKTRTDAECCSEMVFENTTMDRSAMDDVQWIHQEKRYVWVEVLVVFLFGATILANLVLIIVLVKSRRNRATSLTCHMVNLATSQMLMGIFSVPFANFGHYGLLKWASCRMSVPLCYVSLISDRFLMVSTLLAVLMLSTDRLLHFVKQRSWRPAKWLLVTMIALPWCLSAVGTLMFLMYTELVFFEDIRGCSPVTHILAEVGFMFICVVIPATLLSLTTLGLLLSNKIGARLTINDEQSRICLSGDPIQISNRVSVGSFIYLAMWVWFWVTDIDKGIGCRGNVRCLLNFNDGPTSYAIACNNALATPLVWTLFPDIWQTFLCLMKCKQTTIDSQTENHLQQEAIPLNHSENSTVDAKDETTTYPNPIL